MTRVDFFVWPMCNKLQHDVAVCYLIQSALRVERTISVLLDENDECKRFNSLLWTFEETSFLPHGIEDDNYPVKLTINFDKCEEDTLVNLAKSCPTYPERFKRIIETAGHDEQTRADARKKFGTYKSLSIKVDHHKIENATSVPHVIL
ncbi:MAG: DNA polymerase III subunit chi [Pseudomonadota bacterium]|nr:DNA polymerase III subunit chi [Pseudomonadota bacterium]